MNTDPFNGITNSLGFGRSQLHKCSGYILIKIFDFISPVATVYGHVYLLEPVFTCPGIGKMSSPGARNKSRVIWPAVQFLFLS